MSKTIQFKNSRVFSTNSVKIGSIKVIIGIIKNIDAKVVVND